MPPPAAAPAAPAAPAADAVVATPVEPNPAGTAAAPAGTSITIEAEATAPAIMRPWHPVASDATCTVCSGVRLVANARSVTSM